MGHMDITLSDQLASPAPLNLGAITHYEVLFHESLELLRNPKRLEEISNLNRFSKEVNRALIEITEDNRAWKTVSDYYQKTKKPVLFGQISSDTTDSTYTSIAFSMLPPNQLYFLIQDITIWDKPGDSAWRYNPCWVEGGRLFYQDLYYPHSERNMAYLVSKQIVDTAMSEIKDLFGFSTHEKINPSHIAENLRDSFNFALENAQKALIDETHLINF